MASRLKPCLRRSAEVSVPCAERTTPTALTEKVPLETIHGLRLKQKGRNTNELHLTLVIMKSARQENGFFIIHTLLKAEMIFSQYTTVGTIKNYQ